MLCSVALLNLPHQENPSSVSYFIHTHHTQMRHFSPPNSPAHGVIVIGITEAGSFQFAAHHCAGALVPRQVALKSTLTVHAGACDTTDKRKGAHVGSGPGFLWVG